MIADKKRITVGEAADELGVSERHIYRLLRAGELDAIAISESGRNVAQSIRISAASLSGFIERRTIDPGIFFDGTE